MSAFCPQCGAPHDDDARFCPKCGQPVAAAPLSYSEKYAGTPYGGSVITPQGPAAAAAAANQAATFGGVLWIVAALFTGYLALLQLGYGSILGGNLQALGLWNGLAALLTAYFGVRCLTSPSRSFLNWAVFWAVLNVGLGVVQIAGGATHWAYLGSVVSAAIAGVLCFAARDAVTMSPTLVAADVGVSAAAPAKQGLSAVQIAGGLIILAVVLGAAFLVIRGDLPGVGSSAPNSGVSAPGNVPPVGQIWFGSTFDPNTFSMSGVVTTVSAGESVALVAQLPQSISAGDASMRVSLDGTVILNQALSNVKGSGELFGTTVGPFTIAGTYTYEIVDVGGNVLASGTLTVTS